MSNVYDNPSGYYLTVAIAMLNAAIMSVLHVITQATHFLISILALQRFLIYFFPDFEKYLTFTINRFKWMVRSIYGFVIFIAIADHNEMISNVYLISNIILLLSACLYIPITVSIRRFSFLPSAKLNSPERYVLWQLVSIVVFKFNYPLISLAFQEQGDNVVDICRFIDCFSIPLIIQISYFGSNRRNMKKLISTFKFWNYCRKKTAVVSTDNSVNPSTI